MEEKRQKAMRHAFPPIPHTSYSIHIQGFTLIETLVAISLISIAIVTPMSLVSQSFSAAIHARDQVTAYNLAQEGIEAVRAIRDGNILANALQNAGRNLLQGIPTDTPFTIDARFSDPLAAIDECTSGTCPNLQTDGTLYGYASGDPGWTPTNFKRSLTATFAGPDTVNGGEDIIRVSSTVSWSAKNGNTRTFTISENMYRWVADGSAAE